MSSEQSKLDFGKLNNRAEDEVMDQQNDDIPTDSDIDSDSVACSEN